jgi:putative endonuclease
MSIATGELTENIAVAYLAKHKVTVLHRNFRCKLGEIDIVAQDQNCLVFAEVRFRKNDNYGNAAESVSSAKQQKIIRAAKFYLQTRAWAQNCNCRFDVIAMSNSRESPKIEWIKDAFNE